MTDRNRLIDDLTQLASGVAGLAHSAKSELEGQVRARLERYVAEMDFVPRDEFDAVMEMAQRARAENEALAARVAALEAKLS